METQLQLVDHHDTNPVETPATRATQRSSGRAETASGRAEAASDTVIANRRGSASDPSPSPSERAATRPDWRIDDASKARGRAGIALARAALAQARQGRPITSDQRVDHTTAA